MSWDWLLTLLLALYALVTLALTLRILMRRRSVGVTLAWLLFIYIVPLVGFVLYLMFGERYLGRRRARRAETQYLYYRQWLNHIAARNALTRIDQSPLRPVMEITLGSVGMPAMYGNQWRILDRPDDFFDALLADIASAKSWVLMEFYILQNRGRVETVLSALEAARKRGVRVHLLLDSVGSNRFLRSERCKVLRANGVEVLDALHANLFRMSLRRIDLRQHRKLITIDNRQAYTGSMNMADPTWFKKNSGYGPWVDVMVRVEGPIAALIQGTLVFDWEMETEQRLEAALYWPHPPSHGGSLMQFLPSGPALDEDILLQVLLTAIHNARERVIISSPYFVPDEALTQALKSVAKRGLDVTLLVPRRNDSRLAQYAGRSFYDELLSHGVEILRFSEGLLHTKCVLIDDHLALVGSVNLDMRSIWLNFESTLVIDDPKFYRDMHRVIEQYRTLSHRLELSEWRRRAWHKRLLENLAQLASPLL
ncbi:MAG: cardiolipin synthase [Saccharospirillum sp.]